MFLRNCWYAAFWSKDLGRGPESRTILNEPVVFFRKEDGTPVALADRCCHRSAPLSRGSCVGDELQCGYHGLRYDDTGAVVEVPGQTRVPPGARVPLPVREEWKTADLAWAMGQGRRERHPRAVLARRRLVSYRPVHVQGQSSSSLKPARPDPWHLPAQGTPSAATRGGDLPTEESASRTGYGRALVIGLKPPPLFAGSANSKAIATAGRASGWAPVEHRSRHRAAPTGTGAPEGSPSQGPSRCW